MRTWAIVAHALLLFTQNAVAQQLGDPADLLKLIPSCASKCLSSAFSAGKCNNADWSCFCRVGDDLDEASDDPYAVLLNGKTSECAAIGTLDKPGGCSYTDLDNLQIALFAICEDSVILGAANSIVTEAYSLLTYADGIATAALPTGFGALTDASDLDSILTALTAKSGGGATVTATASSAVASAVTSAQSTSAAGAAASASAMSSAASMSSVVSQSGATGNAFPAAGTGMVSSSTMRAAAQEAIAHSAGILYHAGALVLGLLL